MVLLLKDRPLEVSLLAFAPCLPSSNVSPSPALLEGAEILAPETQEKIGTSILPSFPFPSYSYQFILLSSPHPRYVSLQTGVITSGIPSPTLGKNIAMGYIQSGFHKKGTEVTVVVRGQSRKGVVSPMPFVQTKYWRGTAAT